MVREENEMTKRAFRMWLIPILFILSMVIINDTRIFVGLMIFGWMMNLERRLE